MRKKHLKTTCLSLLTLTTACSAIGSINSRINLAQDITRNTMQRRDIPANGFHIASWQKITDPTAGFNIYIEGDGLAWTSRTTPSLNPTPKNPLALRLATIDPAANVIYLARPCQYTPLQDNPKCKVTSWTSETFSPDAIKTMNTAIDNALKQYPSPRVNLIGFSGGGNIAAVLTDMRDDVSTLRTIAGNIDVNAFTAFHHVSPMPNAISAHNGSNRLKTTPQIHYIGADDPIVPDAIFDAYTKALGENTCIHKRIIANATHSKGWIENWPALLKDTPKCQ